MTGIRMCSVVSIKRRSPAMATVNLARSFRQAFSKPLGSMARQVRAQASALVMTKAGEPLDVLTVKELEVKEPAAGQIRVDMLAAPINPSDINTVQGVYPVKPKYDDVPGHEGVAKVRSVGDGATGLQPGDMVVPIATGQGTWRTCGVFNAADWHKVPSDLPINDAATMRVNPCSALGMLEDFVQLSEGDVVVQNGANSSVGQLVIQIARQRGIRTVNVVRDRPNLSELSAQLHALGADVVATPAMVRQMCKDEGVPPAKLALDCIGGESASLIAKMLQKGGTMVTYGAMSKQPAMIPAPLLIFKDIRVRGFWMSGGPSGEDPAAARQALDRVAGLIQAGALKTDTHSVPLEQWTSAFEHLAEGKKRECKFVLTMG
eukprot:jgi/Ulvmu1/6175/UM028_0031.1